MHLEYQLSQADFVHARGFGSSIQSFFGRFHLLRIPLWGVSWVLLVLLFARISGMQVTNWLVLLPALACFIYPLLFDYSGARLYRRMSNLRSPSSVDFSQEFVQFQTNDVTTRMGWKHFTSFAEDNTVFLLFSNGKRCYSIFPKHSMTQPQIDELRTILKTYIPHK